MLEARINRAKGLWIEAVMPRPQDGSFAAEVWQAAKRGIVKAFSLGRAGCDLTRRAFRRSSEVVGCDLREMSLRGIGVNGLTLADATPTAAKSVGGIWLPDTFSSRWDAAVVAEHRLNDLQPDLGVT